MENGKKQKITYAPAGVMGTEIRGTIETEYGPRLVIEIRRVKDPKTGKTTFLTTNYQNGAHQKASTVAERVIFRRYSKKEMKKEEIEPRFPVFAKRRKGVGKHPLNLSPGVRRRKLHL